MSEIGSVRIGVEQLRELERSKENFENVELPYVRLQHEIALSDAAQKKQEAFDWQKRARHLSGGFVHVDPMETHETIAIQVQMRCMIVDRMLVVKQAILSLLESLGHRFMSFLQAELPESLRGAAERCGKIHRSHYVLIGGPRDGELIEFAPIPHGYEMRYFNDIQKASFGSNLVVWKEMAGDDVLPHLLQSHGVLRAILRPRSNLVQVDQVPV